MMATLKSYLRLLCNQPWKRAILASVLIALFTLNLSLSMIDWRTSVSDFESKYDSEVQTPRDRTSIISIGLETVTNRFIHAKGKIEDSEISLPINTDLINELKDIEVTIDLAQRALIDKNLDVAEKYIQDASDAITKILVPLDAAYMTNTISVYAYHNFIGGNISEGLQATTKDGTPVSAIIFSVNGPPRITDKEKVLASCEIQPVGISFSNPTNLVMYYDPADIPAGWLENDLVIIQFTNNDQEILLGEVDTFIHNITAPIEDLGVFSVLAVKPPSPPSFPWINISLSSIIFLLLLLYLLLAHKNARHHNSGKGPSSQRDKIAT